MLNFPDEPECIRSSSASEYAFAEPWPLEFQLDFCSLRKWPFICFRENYGSVIVST